ncbi:MAG: hypothetical protein BGO03_13565 [Mesorhizobium sp. 61-13]|nr:MAG: hypothetical protein BGO03_13565 [Mesorhizobium sp. 61-13]
MSEYPDRQTSKAAGWSRRTGAFSLVLLLTAWVGHHFNLVETPAFLWVLALVALLAAFALLFAGFAFSRLWTFGDRGGHDLMVGAFLALVVLAPFAVAAYWATIYPPLKDISTDLEDPPSLTFAKDNANDTRTPTTPGEQRLQAQAYPLVTGRRYELPFKETVDSVEAVFARQGWQVEGSLPSSDTNASDAVVNAVAKSFVLELPADVAIRVTSEGETSYVDMRSASRYGRHDLGDNAARIVKFLSELDQEVVGQIGTTSTE